MDEVKVETFPAPTAEAVEHYMRELGYEQRLVGHKMAASTGNSPLDMYSMAEAALFLTGNPWDMPVAHPDFKSTLNWIDMGKLVAWLKEVVGDVELASAIERDIEGLEAFMDQSVAVAKLVTERMQQYKRVRDAAAAESGDKQA